MEDTPIGSRNFPGESGAFHCSMKLMVLLMGMIRDAMEHDVGQKVAHCIPLLEMVAWLRIATQLIDTVAHSSRTPILKHNHTN